MLSRKELPPFVRLRTTPDIKAVAKRLAFMKKAVVAIGTLESRVLDLPEEYVEAEMDDVAFLSEIIVKQADLALVLLGKLQTKVKTYVRKL